MLRSCLVFARYTVMTWRKHFSPGQQTQAVRAPLLCCQASAGKRMLAITTGVTPVIAEKWPISDNRYLDLVSA